MEKKNRKGKWTWTADNKKLMLTATMKAVVLFMPFMICYASAYSRTDDFTALQTMFYMWLLLLKCA